MSLYTERDPVKLREIAVALCVETAKRSSTHTSAQLTRVAEETVPPVPTPEPEYNTYKGVTYRDGHWWYGNYAYVSAAMLVWCVKTLTDDDHAALLALKANPVKVATVKVEWPCYKCGGEIEEGARTTFSWCSKCFDAEKATTPATVASEPTRIEKALKSLAKAYPYLAAHADHIDGEFDEALRIVRSALAKPATEAEALAVLVGLGWKEHALSQYVGFSKPDNIRVVRSPMMHVRVLIAPEGK